MRGGQTIKRESWPGPGDRQQCFLWFYESCRTNDWAWGAVLALLSRLSLAPFTLAISPATAHSAQHSTPSLTPHLHTSRLDLPLSSLPPQPLHILRSSSASFFQSLRVSFIATFFFRSASLIHYVHSCTHSLTCHYDVISALSSDLSSERQARFFCQIVCV